MQLKNLTSILAALVIILPRSVAAIPTEESAAAVPTADPDWGVGISFTYPFDEEASE